MTIADSSSDEFGVTSGHLSVVSGRNVTTRSGVKAATRAVMTKNPYKSLVLNSPLFRFRLQKTGNQMR